MLLSGFGLSRCLAHLHCPASLVPVLPFVFFSTLSSFGLRVSYYGSVVFFLCSLIFLSSLLAPFPFLLAGRLVYCSLPFLLLACFYPPVPVLPLLSCICQSLCSSCVCSPFRLRQLVSLCSGGGLATNLSPLLNGAEAFLLSPSPTLTLLALGACTTFRPAAYGSPFGLPHGGFPSLRVSLATRRTSSVGINCIRCFSPLVSTRVC